jgi:hypothetical protein
VLWDLHFDVFYERYPKFEIKFDVSGDEYFYTIESKDHIMNVNIVKK